MLPKINGKSFLECTEEDLKILIDIPHAIISAEFLGISFEEYVNQFDFDKVLEIHFSGTGKTKDGKLYDGHISAEAKHYEYLEYLITKCKNLKMISLEYSPTRDYDGESVAKEYISTRTNEDLYSEQQQQLNKIIEIYQKVYFDQMNRSLIN